MTPQAPATPPFEALLARGQELLAQLAAHQERVDRELADEQARLSEARAREGQLQGELEALRGARQELTAEREQLQRELEALRGARQELAAERERLIGEVERLRKDVTARRAENEALRANQKAHEAQLAELQEQGEQLKELHSHVTEQASKLGADWNARRQALAANNQRLTAEVEQAHKTLVASQERERQWKAQVWKLQDEVRTLRRGAQRASLTPEESHHLISQLNAIIGFAEVLLDEAGNRATGTERQEFLQHIKDSGAQLADYVHKLTPGSDEENTAGQPSDTEPPVETPHAPGAIVLVATTDPTVRERLESFLIRAGFHVEFTEDAEEALKTAVRLQPLAMMIDADLPPSGGQGLVDKLFRDARTRDIPVVLTARNDQEQLGVSIGRYDFLTKPINKQQLLHLMAKYELLADRRLANKMPTSVLVVDDDPRNIRLVEAMLKPYSISLLIARDGATGIKLAIARKPDLVLLDLMMPDVDGFQVVSALREDSTTAQIPILIYTAKNVTKDDRRRLQGSIQSIIRKGELSKEQFLDLVYRRGERRKPLTAEEEEAA